MPACWCSRHHDGRSGGFSPLHREDGASIGRSIDLVTAAVLLVTYVCYLCFMLGTHPDFFAAGGGEEERGAHDSNVARAGLFLVLASIGAAWMSEILVGARKPPAKPWDDAALPRLVLLALIAGQRKRFGDLDGPCEQAGLAVGIAMGSSIQIALFVTPFLALLSLLIAPVPMAWLSRD